ncbi:hypothetical protein OROHE_011012 [Orobanche hederae]
MDICCLCGNAWISACPKKPRGRTKMLKVHGRSPTEKPVITLSKNGQPIGDRKTTTFTITWFLKKLGEANPTLKFDIGDFCPTFSSDQDESGTPITQTPGGATS